LYKNVKKNDLKDMSNEEENRECKGWDKKNPFTVPEGYFDQFPDRLMSRIDQMESPHKKGTLWIRYLRPALGLAASFALVALMLYVPVKLIGPRIARQSEENRYNPYEMEYALYNDLTFFDLVAGQSDKEPMDDNTIETALLVSLNDYELMGY
jgi:hypothetical protein